MSARPAFRTDIQGMRALAVLLVLLWHAEVPGISAGYVGVDVFFVISGFLITGLLLREHASTGRIRLVQFYSRRALRLLPAAGLTLVVTIVGSWIFLPNTQWATVSNDALASVLYFQNWNLASRSVSYFAQGTAPSPLQHFWSLSVEEQFYFVWPVLIVLASPAGSLRTKRPRRNLGVVVLAVVIVSLVWSLYYSYENPSAAYFVTTTRVWQLAIGALLAIFESRIALVSRGVRFVGGWAGLAAILGSSVLIGDTSVFPGVWALAPTLGAVGLLLAGPSENRASVGHLLSWRPFQALGGISYALYLWHWPFVVWFLAARPEAHWGLLLSIEAAAVPVAYLSTKHFEPRFRYLSTETLRAPLAAALGSTAAVVLSALLIQQVIPDVEVDDEVVQAKIGEIEDQLLGAQAFQSEQEPLAETAQSDGSDLESTAEEVDVESGQVAEEADQDSSQVDEEVHEDPNGIVEEADEDSNDVDEPGENVDDLAEFAFGGLALSPDPLTSPRRLQPDNPSTVTPLPAEAGDDRGAFNRCQRNFEETTPRLCSAGDLESDIVVVLVGDSHARQWADSMDLIARSKGWRLDIYAKGACPYADVALMRGDSPYESCSQWNANLRQLLLAEPPFAAVFSGVDHRVSTSTGIVSGAEAHLAHGESYARFWAELEAAGTTVVALADTPRPPLNVPDCVAANREVLSTCTFALRPTGASLRQAAQVSNVDLVDMTDWICPGDPCPVVVGGVLVYRDLTHVSATYTLSLAPILLERLEEVIG